MARPAGTVDLVHLDTISSWLRKHGKPVRPRLDRKQLEALRECFDIIDTNSTGLITTEELRDVFKSLGDHVSLQAVATVLDSVRYHGSSGIGFTDFIDIMSRDSQDLKEGSQTRSNGTTAYNIALMARAYRRKKVMEAVFKDEGDWRARFVHMHERIKDKERRNVRSKLMTESMMPLTSQPSMLDGSADRQKEGTQTSEDNVEQMVQSDSSLASLAPSGSVVLPKTRIRFGTGVLPVIMQSLISELPVDAQPAASIRSQLSASGHVNAPSQSATMMLPAEEPALHAEQKRVTLVADQTPAGSMQGTGRLTGRRMQGGSRLMASDDNTVGQSLGPDLEAADSAEGHVWGAVRTQTGIDNEQSEESVRPVREKKSVHVTPRTRQKLQWLQDAAEAVTPLSWQLTQQQQQQQQSQPSSFSMQLHPFTDTDSGNIKLAYEVAEQLAQACDDASEPGSSVRQVCSSEECHGKLLSQSALGAACAWQADTYAVGAADGIQLASSSTSRSPAGRIGFLANAAGGSIDSDMMALWADATAGGRHPIGATGVSVKSLPAQDHQVSSEMAHTRHASPRNMLRQAAFLGQPHDFPPAGWNTSINPHSSRHVSEPIAQPLGATAMDAEPSTAAATTATSATAVEGASTATSCSTAVVYKAVGSGRPHVPSLGLAALRADRHSKGLQAVHGSVTDGQHQGPSNDIDSSAVDESHSARDRPAGSSLAAQMAKEHDVSHGKAPDALADRHPPAVTMSRPRSSVWANQSTVSQQVLDPDEQPVTYRTQRSFLLPTPQSSRAPWLHTAAVTAGRFKQPSRAQTIRSARQHSFPMQVEPMASGRVTDRSTSLTRRLALQQRLDAKPVAVHQQIRRETQAQVRLLAKRQDAQPALYT